MEVKGAAMSNGLLYIGMQRYIPEHKRPKKISLISKRSYWDKQNEKGLNSPFFICRIQNKSLIAGDK